MTDADWDALSTALGHRGDWHLERDHEGSSIWCFGVDGECRLVISMTATEFILHDHDNDIDYDFGSIEEVAMWLADHEAEHAGLSALHAELTADLISGAIGSDLGDADSSEEHLGEVPMWLMTLSIFMLNSALDRGSTFDFDAMFDGFSAGTSLKYRLVAGSFCRNSPPRVSSNTG
jgi:hypothetical protein